MLVGPTPNVDEGVRMSIQSERDRQGMRSAGRVVALALAEMRAHVAPGITTAELDAAGEAVLRRHGARSAPQQQYNFPGVNCISLNDEAVHGIPRRRAVRAGDLVKLDVTAELEGYIADAAVTVAVPPAPALSLRLRDCAEAAFRRALSTARAGEWVSAIGRAVEAEVRRWGFAVIRELCGHGVGRAIHEEPSVPNYAVRGPSPRLTEGLVLTIEPIIAARPGRVVLDPDGWTTRTANGSLSAHFEHTLIITRGEPEILTRAPA